MVTLPLPVRFEVHWSVTRGLIQTDGWEHEPWQSLEKGHETAFCGQLYV